MTGNAMLEASRALTNLPIREVEMATENFIIDPQLIALRPRFEANTIGIPEFGCWWWLGTPKPNGYCRWHVTGIDERYAHRFSWMLYRGPIPDGLQVCHHCDIRWCVRPEHLFVGTSVQNNEDMYRKGRNRWNPDVNGERNPNRKLSLAEVRAIRAAPKSTTGVVLAEEYGVTSSMIYYIRKNLNWKDIN